MDYYIAHHGVKGMKWGVRKNTGVQRRLRGRKRFDFTTKNGTRLSTRAQGKDVRAMKKRGYIDRHGDVNEGYEKAARNYLLKRNIARTAVGVAVATALVVKGRSYVSKNRGDS